MPSVRVWAGGGNTICRAAADGSCFHASAWAVVPKAANPGTSRGPVSAAPGTAWCHLMRVALSRFAFHDDLDQMRLPGIERGLDRGTDFIAFGDAGTGNAHPSCQFDKAEHGFVKVHLRVALV